jgi:hypothetical protein
MTLRLQAREYYVHPQGSDTALGTISSPFRTINQALTLAGPGDAVLCRGGVYNEGLIVRNGRISSDYLTIKAYQNEHVEVVPAKLYSGWNSIGTNLWSFNIPQELDAATMLLVRKDGDGLFRVNSLGELNNNQLPQIAWEEDLYHFEEATRKVTLRLLSGNLPDSIIYVMDASSRIAVVSPNVAIEGLHIKYAYNGIKTSYAGDGSPNKRGDHARITNNTIENIADQGILATQRGEYIANNTIRFCGKPFRYHFVTNLIVFSNLDHCIYYAGENGTICHNDLSKSHGSELNAWFSPNLPANVQIYNNNIEGSLTLSGLNHKVYNNLIITETQKDYALGTSNQCTAQIYNNIISGNYACYIAPLAEIIFKNNIVLSDNAAGIALWVHTPEKSNLDYNLYGGTVGNAFYVGSGAARKYFNNSAGYFQHMQIQGQENNSFFADPLLESDNAITVNSPVIDRGIAVPGVNEDYNGDSRPAGTAYDIGPYEYTNSEPSVGDLNLSTDEDMALDILLNATDPDSDNLTSILVTNPGHGQVSVSGLILQYQPDPNFFGSDSFQVKVNDGVLDSGIATVSITVQSQNDAPIFLLQPQRVVNTLEPVNFTISATDPENDPVAYTAQNLPNGAVFNNQTFDWTPSLDDTNLYTVNFIASDGQAQSVLSVTINVIDSNHPPQLMPVAAKQVQFFETLTFTVSASDPDLHPVTISAGNLPDGASFNGQQFSWRPDADQAGTHIVNLVASDGELQDTETVTITVTADQVDNDAPVVMSVTPSSGSVQVSLNSLVVWELADSGEGIDAASVEIRADGDLIFQNDTADYISEKGHCRRMGTPGFYSFAWQPVPLFGNDQTVTLTLNARDLAGNAMEPFVTHFTTEMLSFGGVTPVSGGVFSSPTGRAVSVQDPAGTVWVAWQGGLTGSRSIYLSRKVADSTTFDVPITISENESDQINPALAIDSEGRLFLCWQEDRRGNWDIYVVHSADGVNWSIRKRITDADSDQVNPDMAISGSKAYVVWQDNVNATQDIYVASSTNNFSTITIDAVTNHSALQIDPRIATAGSTAYVVWTDLRSGVTDLYGADSATGWANIPVVNQSANQSQASIAADQSGTLHLAWVDDRSGNSDIFYAVFANGFSDAPLSGRNLIDDTSGRVQSEPSITVDYSGGDIHVYVSWQDERNSLPGLLDSDIYMADASSGSGANVLVTNQGQTANQRNPSLFHQADGTPYLFWLDDSEGVEALVYAGAVKIDPIPIVSQFIDRNLGGQVGTPLSNISSSQDVGIEVPPGAFRMDIDLSVSRVGHPVSIDSIDSLISAYEFGPSSELEFARPVTVTIPFDLPEDEIAAGVAWYNPQTGQYSQAGLSNIEVLEITPSLFALRFDTTHFSQYAITAKIVETSTENKAGKSSNGGCALSPDIAGENIADYFLPYILVGVVYYFYCYRDRRKPAGS